MGKGDDSGKAAATDNAFDFDQLQRCRIWEKLKKGDLHAITKKNVEEFVQVLDKDEKGDISKDDLMAIRQVPGITLTEEDIQAIAEDADVNKNGRICAEELFRALTQGELCFNLVKEKLGKQMKAMDEKELPLDKVVEYLDREYEVSSALWSLPQTIILFALFMSLMSWHLDLTTAFEMQGGLLAAMGFPEVADIPTTWDWIDTAWVPIHFQQDLDTFPFPGRVASYNQIIGGIELVNTQILPKECSQSDKLARFYDTRTLRCYRSDDTFTESEFFFYHLQESYVHERIANLTANHWVDQNTTTLESHVLFYNAHLVAFTDCLLSFEFKRNGLVFVDITMETFLSEPYFEIHWIWMDVLFVLVLIRMLYSEARELIPAIRNGWDGFMSYVEFWNCVDWVSIVAGTVVIGLWTDICLIVSGPLQDAISLLPKKELDDAVFANRTYLTPEEMYAVIPQADYNRVVNSVGDLARIVAGKHENLRLLVFWYAFVLQMKFFKAFQANPRLDIVVRTLTMSAVEITHFIIVFFTIFMCFSSAGYVVWGKVNYGFSDQYRAMLMCWRILMGEFDITALEDVNYYYSHIWLILFQFVVLLVMLNMVLAIIMDTYVAAKGEAGEDQVTIWTQVKEACYTLQETQGFLPLYTVLLELQDEDYPAHPNPRVTSKSLRRAFYKKMTKSQADYILRKTVDFIKHSASSIEFGLSDTVRLLSVLKVNVARNVDDTQQILELLKDRQSSGQRARQDEIWSGEEPAKAAAAAAPALGGAGAAYPATRGAGPGAGGGPGASGLLPGAVPGGMGGLGGAAMQSATAARRSQSAGKNVVQRGDSGLARPQSEGGFGGFGGGAVGGVEAIMGMLEQMHASMQSMRMDLERVAEAQRHELGEQKKYIEERDTWLEQRLNAVERRCEKVELQSEKLLTSWNDMDLGELAGLPHRVEALLKPNFSTTAIVRVAGEEGAEPGGPGTRDAGGSMSNKALNARLDDLSAKLDRLTSHADEAAEQRRLLWKIDLGIRQLRQGAAPEPPRTTPTANARHDTRLALRQQMRAATNAELLDRSPPDDAHGSGADAPALASSPTAGSSSTPARLPGVPGRGPAPDRGMPSTPTQQAPPRPTGINADRG